MKIWIDIVNTPHVRFFNGIIKKLRKDGHEVLITARDFSNIHDLLDIFGLEYTSIGDHGVTLEENYYPVQKEHMIYPNLLVKKILILQLLNIQLNFHV